MCHLSGAIDEFLTRHPDLTINIDFSDRHLDLIEEGIDLAFRIADLKNSSLMARKIAPIKRILCASPTYLGENGTPEKPGDLAHHRLLHYNSFGPSNWKLEDHKGHQHSIHVTAKIIANNGDFLKEMAIAGHGILITPSFISWRAITSGQLVQVLPDYKPPQLNAYAVYPQTRYLSHRTRALIDFLVERFGDNPYWDQSLDAHEN